MSNPDSIGAVPIAIGQLKTTGPSCVDVECVEGGEILTGPQGIIGCRN